MLFIEIMWREVCVVDCFNLILKVIVSVGEEEQVLLLEEFFYIVVMVVIVILVVSFNSIFVRFNFVSKIF